MLGGWREEEEARNVGGLLGQEKARRQIFL